MMFQQNKFVPNSCICSLKAVLWMADSKVVMVTGSSNDDAMGDRWHGSITLLLPGTGRSEGLWAGCWDPTLWSPASLGPGCLIHLKWGGTAWTPPMFCYFTPYGGKSLLNFSHLPSANLSGISAWYLEPTRISPWSASRVFWTGSNTNE